VIIKNFSRVFFPPFFLRDIGENLQKIIARFFPAIFLLVIFVRIFKKNFARIFPAIFLLPRFLRIFKKNFARFSFFFAPDICENLQKILHAFLTSFFCLRLSCESKKIFGAFLKINFFALDIIVIIKNFSLVFFPPFFCSRYS